MTTTDAVGSAFSKDKDEHKITDYAKVDPGLFGRALFRPLPKQNRSAARRQECEIYTTFGGRTLRIVSPYTLGPDDLLILLAICGLCGILGLPISVAGADSQRLDIRDGLESDGEVVNARHIRLRTTHYAILREAGLKDGGDAYVRVIESLKRMSKVRYFDDGCNEDGSMTSLPGGSQNLLSVRPEQATGKAVIVLNARFTAALLGGQFIRIELDEFRSLKERGRLLHMRLSVMIRQGKSLQIPIDDLAEKVYGEPPRDGRQKVDRRKYIRSALKDIDNLSGWECMETSKPRRMWRIERLRRNTHPKSPSAPS